MLNNRDYKWTIYDFNMSLLKTRYKDFLTRPPKSKIIYRIEHLLDYNKEDSAMSKLMPFLIYNNDGEFVEEVNDDGQSDIVRIVAEIELLYEFDLKFLDNYKKEMEKVDTFDDFIKALKRLQSKFVVGFRKTTTNEYVERNVVNKIFEIEKVDAVREISKLTENSKKFLNQKFKKHDIDTIDVAQNITKDVQIKCKAVIDDIDNDIEKDQDSIGISNGKNNFVSNFEYSGDLTEMFKYELKNVAGEYQLPLDNNGLGYNNLIYIRNLIKEKKDNDYNILLIEEPEAHLHPNMQYKLLKFICSQQSIDKSEQIVVKNQIFVTTHSSNITASVPFNSMIIFYSEYRDNIANIVTRNLINNFHYETYVNEDELKNKSKIQMKLNQSKDHLEKFLDVTRSDLLFATRIILVEGIAEKLLLPARYPELIDNHVSIIEVGGINFNHFIPLCFNTGKKILCITDKDFSYFKNKNGNSKEFVGIEEIKKMQKKVSRRIYDFFKMDKDILEIATQLHGGNTFETELFIDNYDMEDQHENVKKLMREVCPKCLNTLINELTFDAWIRNISNIKGNGAKNTKVTVKEIIQKFEMNYNACDDEIKKREIEKFFFVEIFYNYAKFKKGDLALALTRMNNTVNLPNYIEEGIKWIME